MKTKGVNLDKIDRMVSLVFENALRLHFDSILLFKNKSYPSAFFLSVLVLEELGKMYMLEDFLYYSRSNGRLNEITDKETIKRYGPDLEEFFLKEMYYHLSKQRWFMSKTGEMHKHILGRASKICNYVYSNRLEELKQNSIYVGFDKKGKRIDLKGKIKTPFMVSKEKAQNQITYINDFLLRFTLNITKQTWITESDYLESFINKRIFNKLEKKWKISRKKTKVEIEKLKKFK